MGTKASQKSKVKSQNGMRERVRVRLSPRSQLFRFHSGLHQMRLVTSVSVNVTNVMLYPSIIFWRHSSRRFISSASWVAPPELDGETDFGRIKIEDERADAVLPAEFYSGDLRIPDTAPDKFFGEGRVAPEFSSGFFLLGFIVEF